MNNKIVVSTKTLIMNILKKVRMESDMQNLPEYYIGFVIMMYLISSSILSEMGPDNIKKVVKEIKDSENKK